MTPCPRCIHLVGEHLLCRDHGGESGFTAGAYKLKPAAPKYPPCPPEAAWDYTHPWWAFLDCLDDLREAG